MLALAAEWLVNETVPAGLTGITAVWSLLTPATIATAAVPESPESVSQAEKNPDVLA